jgi:flagellar hook-basal body complex protein FliE
MDGINNLNGINTIKALQPKIGVQGEANELINPPMMEDKRASFKELLVGSIKEVNLLQKNADQAVETLMTGGEIGTAEVLTAVQKADLAFKMMMQMRNKMVTAYQEIQSIRV